MRRFYRYAVAVLLVSVVAGKAGGAESERAVSGKHAERVEPPIADERNVSTNKLPFRISAMTKSGKKVYLGLIDEGTGRTLFLKRGEVTWSGFEFIDIDYEKGRALFGKGGKIYAGSIAASDLPGKPGPRLSRRPPGARAPGLPEGMEPPPMAEKMPDETMVLMIDSNKNESLTVYAGEKHENGLRIEHDGKNYAIPRNVAAGLLRSDFMSDEMKARALKSFPGLVELDEGEDVDKALAARGKMAFPDIQPPPEGVPEAPPMAAPPQK